MPDDTNLDGMVDASGAPPLPGKRRHAVASPTTKPAKSEKPAKAKPPVNIDVAADDIIIKPLQIDTAQSDAAIDDIVAQEADTVLAAQDAGIEAATDAAEADAPPYNEPPKRRHPVFWFLIILLVIIAVAALVILMSPGLSPSFAP